MTNVLVSGAGVAGITLAYWLRRHGFTPTVVERAPGLRAGGQAIDIRGVALEVAGRTGVLDEARRLRTGHRGMVVYDGEGNEIMRSEEMTYSSGRIDNDDIELLREDLTRLLYERTRGEVTFLFGDSITALEQDERGVLARFEHAEPRRYDLVVGADGLHSTVRRLAFGPEREFVHHLGTYLAVFGMDNFLGLEDWQVWMQDGTRGYGVFPVRGNTELRITLGFQSEPLDHRDPARLRAAVAEAFAGAGGETQRLLKGMEEASDFYCDSMAQIHLDRWSSGRVALIGDAAYCPSPLSGQGTSLALVGAYVLAAELAAAGGAHEAAFARYERRMRPFVALNQALATENPGRGASEESVDRAKDAISLDE
jgi:2-polyprenyl-6-methoxyphenol hydroxylase-like FAD-dependent oxidoreductase